MAFKMKGFNPGVGTGMNSALKKSSAFHRDDKDVASNPDAKNPEEGGKVEELSFGEAFNRAKKQGKKTFTWEGKSYTTETEEEKAKLTQSNDDPLAKAPDTEGSDEPPKKEGGDKKWPDWPKPPKKPSDEAKDKLIEILKKLAKTHPVAQGIDFANKTIDWLQNKIDEIRK
jgi:hypothetical protein